MNVQGQEVMNLAAVTVGRVKLDRRENKQSRRPFHIVRFGDGQVVRDGQKVVAFFGRIRARRCSGPISPSEKVVWL